MDSRTSNTIAPTASSSPADDVVLRAIDEMHALGLQVMLKPHVDVHDGTWRGRYAGGCRISDTDSRQGVCCRKWKNTLPATGHRNQEIRTGHARCMREQAAEPGVRQSFFISG